MKNKVSSLVKETRVIDSKSYNELSPVMKEAIKDIFKIIENEQKNIIEKFEEDDIETSNIATTMQSNFDILYKRIECLEKYTKLLELKIDSMKK
jgi:TRAP-type C4-dicarboxylate transport system substrate-binding protein